MSALFDVLVSLDASLAACDRPQAALDAFLDILPSLLPCAIRGVATIDDTTLLPVLAGAAPTDAHDLLSGLLADAVDHGRFALALRRGQPVIHELADASLVVLQAVATPTHLAGLVIGICPPDQAGAERLAALALASARTGSAHEGLTLRARITAHADELEKAVAERTRDLAAARDRAESSSRAKSAFLATVSHELRTPLNGIIGMAELLHADEGDHGRRDRLGVIRTCAEDLLRQIDSILDLSRIEAGRQVLNPSEADPAALVMAVLRTLAPQAQGKGVELAWIPTPDFPTRILVDAGRLRQVVMNLVGNALKFSERGCIAVRASAEADRDGWRLAFAISDQGPGIAPEAQARLFTPFEQGDASINRRFGGSGLGLTISKRLCELMGGGIDLRSEVGVGSTFTVRIKAGTAEGPHHPQAPWRFAVRCDGPLREALAAATACVGGSLGDDGARLAIIDGDAEHAPELIDRLPHGLPVLVLAPLAGARAEVAVAASRRQSRQISKPVDAAALAAAASELLGGQAQGHVTARLRAVARFDGARVLYTDDQQVNRLVLAGQLRRLGVEVELATGGAEAIQRAAEGSWDLILLDCQMPEVDGFQAAARIREGGCRTPLVAVTAHAMAGDREECLLRGFDDYLAKPVRPAELADILARWIHRETGQAKEAAPPPPPPDRFAQLRAEVGDDIARDVLAAMLAEGPHLAEEAVAAAKAGDLAVAGKRAHALKGDAGNLGLDELSGIARELEQAAKAGDRATAL
ncbi:MAG: response regulator, partial [Planctomycetes bacterium]|nr:response regulator [Planctomycetota bacterium]